MSKRGVQQDLQLSFRLVFRVDSALSMDCPVMARRSNTFATHGTGITSLAVGIATVLRHGIATMRNGA